LFIAAPTPAPKAMPNANQRPKFPVATPIAVPILTPRAIPTPALFLVFINDALSVRVRILILVTEIKKILKNLLTKLDEKMMRVLELSNLDWGFF
jgi:hypothetical protein